MGLVSCAHVVQKKTRTPEEFLKKICLSGSGKGRLEFLSEKYRFSYDSSNDIKEKRWTLAVNVPLLGEEVVELNYVKAAEENVQVNGAFYERLEDAAKESSQDKYQLEMLNSYLKTFGKFLVWSNDIRDQINGKKNRCKLNNGVWSCSFLNNKNAVFNMQMGLSTLEIPLDDKMIFKVEGNEGTENFYEQVTLRLVERSRNPSSSGIYLEMYPTECHN